MKYKAATVEMTVTAFSYLELIRPISKLLTRGIHAEHLAILERGTGAARLKLLIGLTHATATGRGERNDRLISEIVALQEGIDYRWRDIPPDGETHVDRIIFSYVVTERFNLRAGGRIVHLNRAARSLVPPIQIRLRISNPGNNLKQICAKRIRQVLSDLRRYATCR